MLLQPEEQLDALLQATPVFQQSLLLPSLYCLLSEHLHSDKFHPVNHTDRTLFHLFLYSLHTEDHNDHSLDLPNMDMSDLLL